MKKIELLAPAGTIESLYAAVLNGADAVYLGGSKFSARAYATNFTDEDMKNAVEYCHIYGVKIYVTINTLIKDNEIKEALEYAGFLNEIGVDAIIIQDLGLAYLIRNNYPNLELHASTQMTVHNLQGAKLLYESGYSRIVLSRELSIKEISNISNAGIETEVFVHGALCISYSGACLMSSMIGGRSGNRGKCAQSCRLPYDLINKNTNEKKSGFLLSPKDLGFLGDIDKLIESGTASLKIEGRMKRPEYVAGVVAIYRKAIDCYYNNESFDFEKEYKTLLQLFNREGLSTGYLHKNLGKDLMSYKFPKNTGVEIGISLGNGKIKLSDSLSKGDGIRSLEDGLIVASLLKNGLEVISAAKGDEIFVKACTFKKGEIVYKTSDEELLKRLSKSYEDKYTKKFKIDLLVSFKAGEPFKIKAYYNDREYIINGDVVQKAIKKPVEMENIILNLKKTGNTPYEIENIGFEEFTEGFLPISSLNAVRRELFEEIYEDIKINKDKTKNLNFNREEKKNFKIPKLIVSVQTMEQLKAAYDLGVRDIAIDYFIRKSDIEICELKDINIYIKTSAILKGEFNSEVEKIEKLLPEIKGIITSNFGIISYFLNKTEIIGDYKINAFNKYSFDFFSKYLNGIMISLELNKNEINEASKNPPIETQQLIYGRVEVMISEYCPIGSTFGNLSEKSPCNIACEKSEFILKDRKNADFLVKTDKFCRSHIYNSVPLNLISNLKEIKQKVNSIRVDFIDENYERAYKILSSIINEEKDNTDLEYTKGHYKRGVE